MAESTRIINEEFLERLVNAAAPTGSEERAQRIYRDYLKDIANDITTDVMGSVNAVLNPSGAPKIMLAGHCDEVGFQVKYINDKGFIYVNSLGGVDSHIVPGHRVRIMTKEKDITGIIGRKATHLVKPDERKKVTELKDQYVDVGVSSKEEVEELGIQIGDPIVFTEKYDKLGDKGVVVARCFDDRIGVFIIAETLRLLKNESFEGCVCGVSTTQEEIGTRGAITSTYGINPDIGIALDVWHATDSPDISEKDVGRTKLGGGPIVMRGPNINPKLFELIMATAKEEKITVQVQAIRGQAGNDGRSIQMSRSGVVTGIIEIPNRYMHTMSETVHLDDVDSTVRLLVALIKKITKDTSFIPE
jgi:endoglucanase